MVRCKSGSPRCLVVFQNGRLLRIILCRRRSCGRGPRYRLIAPRRARGNANSNVRRAPSRFGGLSCPPDQTGLSRGHRRTNGGPEGSIGQTADQARGRARHHAGNDHRGGAPGGWAAEPSHRPGVGQGRTWRCLGGRIHRVFRDDCVDPIGASGSAWSSRPSGDFGAAVSGAWGLGSKAIAGDGSVDTPDIETATGRNIRDSQPGRIRHVHRRRGRGSGRGG